MKKIIAFILLSGYAWIAISNSNGVKVRSALNYNPGDTLIYKTVLCPTCGPPSMHTGYFCIAILSKTYSAAMDTVYYSTNNGSFAITHLDSPVSAKPFQGPLLNFDTFTINNPNRITDTSYRAVFSDQSCGPFTIVELMNPANLAMDQNVAYADSLGLISQSQADENNTQDPISNFQTTLIYYKKNSKFCGLNPFAPLAVNDISGDNQLEIYPQMTANSILIQASSGILCSYVITNTFGQIEMLHPNFVTERNVDVSKLSAGMHYLTIHYKADNADEYYRAKQFPFIKE